MKSIVQATVSTTCETASKLFWREVAKPQPWWRITKPKPEYELRWAVLGGIVALGGYAAYRYKTRDRPIVIKIDPIMIASESLVPGSPLLENGRIPDCQVQLAVKRGETYVIIGGGVRVENFLITPTHNGHHGQDLYMIKNGKAVKIDVTGEFMLAADVSAFPLLESTWSQLGIRQAKLGPLNKAATVTVTSSCDSKYSIGSVKPSQDIIGRMTYDASTMPGFSGSAYMNGNVCLGMHCHGGVRGGGYEMLYLWCRLKAQTKEIPEESGDFILNAARDQSWTHEELNDGKTVLRLDSGHYHLATDEIMVRMRSLKNSKSWADEVEYEDYEKELQSRGYEPEGLLIPRDTFQGEFRRPAVRAGPGRQQSAPQVSLSTAEKPVLQPTKRQKLINRLQSISTEQLELFLASKGIGKLRARTMRQQTQAPGPSGIASTSNSATPQKGASTSSRQQ